KVGVADEPVGEASRRDGTAFRVVEQGNVKRRVVRTRPVVAAEAVIVRVAVVPGDYEQRFLRQAAGLEIVADPLECGVSLAQVRVVVRELGGPKLVDVERSELQFLGAKTRR